MSDLESILRVWGPSGLILVFAIWMIRMVLVYALEKDKKRDEQVVGVIKDNTEAFHELKDVLIQLSNKSENIEKSIERSHSVNTDILQFIKMRA